MAHLQFYEDGRPLFIHLLRPGRTLVGRSDRADIALPSDTVSRTHCAVERRPDGWWLIDQSRRGTPVNGVPTDRHLLCHGDVIRIGRFEVSFSVNGDPAADQTTTVSPVMPALHEALVEVGADEITTWRAELTFIRGSREGQTVPLARMRTTVGGTGADVLLSPDMPRVSARIRMARGRIMIDPGDATCFLAGMRVREIMPVLNGEELRIGEHGFTAQIVTVTEAPTAEIHAFGEMVGRSKVMRNMFGILRRVSAHDDPLLITGESGTGKELAARAVHLTSGRGEKAFVAVNCAAITDSLFESEFFGHERGSFTGAHQRQDGAFQQADGGTLFLDEIGELRSDAQAKLLRALESGEVRRVGGTAPEYPDLRVIAATNRDLGAMVKAGTFRADLYFRLAVLTVRLPSLRERRDDIAHIAKALMDRNHRGARLDPSAISALEGYSWPGNVRELRNVLTRAFVMTGPAIDAAALEFQPWVFDGDDVKPPPAKVADEAERELLVAALGRHNGNRSRAARDLGVPRSTLLYKLRRYGIDGG